MLQDRAIAVWKSARKPFTDPVSWQWYRDFFSLSYLRYMASWFAIVPVAAYVLSKTPRQVSVSFLEPPLVLNSSLPFSWQILWVGSLAFVAAFIVYLLRAPKFVRRYHSLDDYLAKGHSPRWISWEAQELYQWKESRAKFFERMTKKGYVTPDGGPAPPDGGEVLVEDSTTNFRFCHDGQIYRLPMPQLDTKGNEDERQTNLAVREIFWEIFGRYASSRIISRRIITTCLFVALACVVVVIAQHIFAALPYVFSRW